MATIQIDDNDTVMFSPIFGDEIYMQCPNIGSIGSVTRVTIDQALIFQLYGIVLPCCIVKFDGYDHDMLIYTEDLIKINNYA